MDINFYNKLEKITVIYGDNIGVLDSFFKLIERSYPKAGYFAFAVEPSTTPDISPSLIQLPNVEYAGVPSSPKISITCWRASLNVIIIILLFNIYLSALRASERTLSAFGNLYYL